MTRRKNEPDRKVPRNVRKYLEEYFGYAEKTVAVARRSNGRKVFINI